MNPNVEEMKKKGLSISAILFYLELIEITKEKKIEYVKDNNNTLAKKYAVSVKTISVWVNSLKKAGYIDVEMIYNENHGGIDYRKITLKKI